MLLRLLPITTTALWLICGVLHLTIATPVTSTVPKPFFFTENKGQWDARVLYKCQAKNGMTWFLERDGITLLISREQGTGNGEQWEAGRGGWQPPTGGAVRRTFLSDDVMENDLPEMLRRHPQEKNPMKSHALKFKFLKNETRDSGFGDQGRGGLPRPPEQDNIRDLLRDSRTTEGNSFRSPNPEFRTPCEAQSVEAHGELPWKNNYFLGNDSSKWAPNCRNFSTVVYREVWDGIDIEWYENDGKLEFDFVVHPGFDPSQIRMSVEGLEGDRISGFGALETGLSLRGSAATKQSLSGNGEQAIGNGGNVRALLRDSRTTGGTGLSLRGMKRWIVSREADSRSEMTKQSQTSEKEDCHDVTDWKERADMGVHPYPSPNTQYPSPTDNVRALLRDARTTGRTVHRTFLSDGVKDNSRGVWHTPQTSGRGGLPRPPELEVGHSCPTNGVATKQSISGNGEWVMGNGVTGTGGPQNSLSAEDLRGTDDATLCIGSDVAIPATNKENVRALLRDARTTGGIFSRTPSPEFRTPIAQSPLPIAELRLQTSLGELRTALPSVYQVSANGTRNEIEATFELTDHNTFGIVLPNGHDADHTLRIDPLIYSTFIGGSNIEAGLAIICDSVGNATIAGYTYSTNYPLTTGALDTTNIGGDCIVTQLNSAGSQLLFSTYLGGTEGEIAYALADDGNDGIIITGSTGSSDFPTTPGAFDRTYNGFSDCFVARLNRFGSQLIYSTYLGGYEMDIGYAITGDGGGGAYVCGETNSSDFPSTNGVLYQGMYDCFVTHLNNTGTQLLFSSFLGGSSNDEAYGIISNGNGVVTVTGCTYSTNFPHYPNAYQTSLRGTKNAFIARLNLVSSTLVYGTYLGGSGSDVANAIIGIDTADVIITGTTNSSDFPTTDGAFDTIYHGGEYNGDCFITRINSTGTQLIYSTYIGGSGSEYFGGIVSNGNHGVFITGSTRSTDFPTTTATTLLGAGDAFITNLDSTGSRLLYSTYFGGSGSDGAGGVADDGSEGVIVHGGTNNSDFPITDNAFDTSFNGGNDFVIFRMNFDTTDVFHHRNHIVQSFMLCQNYPNPFNSRTVIEYSVPRYSRIRLELFDLLGRNVGTFIDAIQNAGVYHVSFDGQNLSSGTYFVRMQAGEFVKTQKMVLLK